MYNELSGNEDITVFDLTDSIGNKELDKSIQILDELLSKGEKPILILKTLLDRFNKLYSCKIAITLDKDVAEFLSLERRQEFLIPKFKKHSKNFTEGELVRIISALEILKTLYNVLISMDLGLALKSIIWGIGKKSNMKGECKL